MDRVSAIFFLACTCLLSSTAYAQRSTPITLSDAEWVTIDALIEFPRPVKIVERTARRYASGKRLWVQVKSEPYEVTPKYRRFYFVNCSKADERWRCNEVQEAVAVAGMHWFVWLKSPIASEEVLAIADAVSIAWNDIPPDTRRSTKPLSLRALQRSGERYFVTASAGDAYCFSDFSMKRLEDGTFSPDSPIRPPSRCY